MPKARGVMMFRNSARPKAIRIVLGLYGLLAVIFGLSYTSILTEALPAPPGLNLITDVLPIWVWGGLWIAAGLMGVLSVFTSLRWEFRIGFNILVWLQMLWTFSFLTSWVFNIGGGKSSARDYVAAAVFGFGALGLIGIIQLLAPVPPAPRFIRRRRG